jgi:hypothetical protein
MIGTETHTSITFITEATSDSYSEAIQRHTAAERTHDRVIVLRATYASLF